MAERTEQYSVSLMGLWMESHLVPQLLASLTVARSVCEMDSAWIRKLDRLWARRKEALSKWVTSSEQG
eukprot:gene27992-biopygen24022